MGLLQGPQENDGEPVLLLPWLRPYSGGLPGTWSKQELLEVRHVQRNHSAAFALREKINPGIIIFRGQCVAWFFGKQPRRGSLREAANEVKQVVKKEAKARHRALIERDFEVRS